MNFILSITTLFLSSYIVTASDYTMLSWLRSGTERDLQSSCTAWEYFQNNRCNTCPTGQVANAAKTGCVYCPAGSVRGADGKASTECQAATDLCPAAYQYGQYGTCQSCPTGQIGKDDKTGCAYCPSGSARGADGTALTGCEPASDLCQASYLYAQYGTCQTCPTGQVSNAEKTGCAYCPAGTARGADGKASTGCVAASELCPASYQYAQYGTCQTCPTGQVGNEGKSGCAYCPAGTARGTDGKALTGCEAASSLCPGGWQYAQYGSCQNCPTGQNSNSKKTGCEYCPPGSIRGDATGASLASCTGVCSRWQHAQYGACQNCPTGQVGGSGNVGCQYCAPGTVRGADGKTTSGCVDAAGPCPAPYQYGQYGQCQTCPNGQVTNDLKTGCAYCPAGSARGSDGKATTGCDPGSNICPLPYQYAQYGQCQTCPTGQVPTEDKKGCTYCLAGTVRGSDGKATTGCVAASGVCTEPYQYGQYGSCQTCPTGQVSNEGKSGCGYCQAGTVRGADGKASSGCVSAATVCTGPRQYGQYGACQTCPSNQVANDNKDGCKYP